MAAKHPKQHKSLAEWVRSTTPGTMPSLTVPPMGIEPAPEPDTPTSPVSRPPRQRRSVGGAISLPRYVPLAIWAQLMFGEYPPM